jgi:hypothetical protein
VTGLRGGLATVAARPAASHTIEGLPGVAPVPRRDLGPEEDEAVRFRWRAREHERTCTDCGYAWRVPRTAARKPIAGFSMAPRGRGVRLGGINPVASASEPEIAASRAISEEAAAFGQCPKCGSDRFSQRPARP